MFRTPSSLKVQARDGPAGDATRLSGVGRLRICSTVKAALEPRCAPARVLHPATDAARATNTASRRTADRALIACLLKRRATIESVRGPHRASVPSRLPTWLRGSGEGAARYSTPGR